MDYGKTHQSNAEDEEKEKCENIRATSFVNLKEEKKHIGCVL